MADTALIESHNIICHGGNFEEKSLHSYKIVKYQVIPAVLKQEKVGVQIKKWKDVVNTGWLLLN